MKAISTFGTFVLGPSNQRAFDAALKIARAKEAPHSLLILHGTSGLGKTHLMMAIEQELLEGRPQKRVAHLAAEKFANEYLMADDDGRLLDFRDHYRKIDVLLLDDIQRLVTFPQPVLWALRELFEPHRRIVFTCDMSVVSLTLIDSEFMAYLHDAEAVGITPPDLSTRLAILRAKANDIGVVLPEPMLRLLAVRLPGNIFRLEGVLFRLKHALGASGRTLDLPDVEAVLRDVLERDG